ncbi:Nucleotide-binding alpha-beta plait [Penicillium angulare]|uniref:Nucleotide-binding alpha-beta plait n=1 Tax=Penicillium angulare TaxID=116970 RepID=UPI0025401C42|nr:Nucleotide-binding alpha-beta plait [Penicillium angulare]KAJ5288030.1 Nucleotide-binding alpha-beta plait [Penicillium angulare]
MGYGISGPSPLYGDGYQVPCVAFYTSQPFYATSPPPTYGPNSHQISLGVRMTSCMSESSICKQTTEKEYNVSRTIVDGSNPRSSGVYTADVPTHALLANSKPVSPDTVHRPLRKPKQSHPLWVGNLPRMVDLTELKDYCSQGATEDIESVFLISKSNCAFVNYRSAAASATALARLHHSVFQDVRLVCRPRKSITELDSVHEAVAFPSQQPCETLGVQEKHMAAVSDAIAKFPNESPHFSERYFIIKSLTVNDLELSKQSGIWTTQIHNEFKLNHAFGNTNHVYLIFSANRSGEYFGYARMSSPIADNGGPAFKLPLQHESMARRPGSLVVTPTVASLTAPRGQIVHDTGRDTIFWEVESLERHSEQRADEKSDEEMQAFGKPFHVQWLSYNRVPFHRTRGLRNPWNSNREVKIAHDGTELEPTVGQKLIELFDTMC